MAIPDIVAGNASIVREELVPFFDFGSQFWGDASSKLTSSEEVRTSYSFWTAWVRFNPILPFALIILSSLSAFLLFYAFHRVGRHFYKNATFGIVAAFLSAFLIHAILLYAKVAHFYVLIIGFSMFSLSLSLALEQLFFKQSISKRNVIAVALLALLNPAIHYHVIFYLVLFLIIIIRLLFTFALSRATFWRHCRRDLLYFILLVVLSLVPYVVFIFATTSSSLGNVSANIPVNYWMIYYASLSLPFIFSLDTAGHLDMIRHGNYFAPVPRFTSIIALALIAALFTFKGWVTQRAAQKLLTLTLLIVLLFSVWMTIGYSDNSPYSFHQSFGQVAAFLDSTGGQIGEAIAKLMSTFINILRFPHRFQFIYYYAIGILFMLALVWLKARLQKKLSPIAAALCIVAIAVLPLVVDTDYRTALTSGDMATFARPYKIPDDLKNIKQILGDKAGDNQKLFILPTLESGREIESNGHRYSFLDKYLIYYLGQPTYYYGIGADTENKITAYLAYRAFAYDEPWWQFIISNTIGATDILVPKHLASRESGVTYLEGIEDKINRQLANSTLYTKTYDGEDFTLYSIKEEGKPSQNMSTLVDFEWKHLLEYLHKTQEIRASNYFPLSIRKFLQAEGQKLLVTDNLDRSFYDIYTALYPEATFTPRPASLPFDQNYIASSNFTNNALSLSILYAKDNQYNYLHENVPNLANLQHPAFIGLTKGAAQLKIPFTIQKPGSYRVLLHAASSADTISAQLGEQQVQLKKISEGKPGGDYIDFSYYTLDTELKDGSGTIAIENSTQNAVLIDSVSFAPVETLDYKAETSPFYFVPTGRAGEYQIAVGERR